MGYPLDHWAGLTYSLSAAWPWFALTAKRLHDSGRSLALAVPAMAGLPAAEAARLVHDCYGVPAVIPVTLGGFSSGLMAHLSLARKPWRKPVWAAATRLIARGQIAVPDRFLSERSNKRIVRRLFFAR